MGKMDLNEVSERDLRVPGIGEITAERIVDRREELGYFTHWSDLHGIPYLGPNKMRILTENFYIGTRNPGTSCYNDYPNNQRSYTTAAPSPLAELPGLRECKTEFQVLKEAQHPIPKSRFPNNAPAHSERQNFKPVKQTTKLGKMDLNEVSERDLRVPGIGEITAERIADRREELGYFTHWSDLHGIPYLGPNKMRILTENFYIGARNPGTSCYNDYPNNQRSYTTAAPSPLAELPGLGECKTEFQVLKEAQHPIPKSRFPNNAPAHSERQNFKPVKQTTKLGKMDLNEVSERDLRVPGIGEITAERIVDRREELGYFTHWSDLHGIPYLGPNKMRILTENFYIGARNPGTSCYNDYPNNQRSYTTAAPSPLAELPGLGECKTEFQVLKEAQHPIPKSRFPNNAPAHSERQNFKPVKQTTKLGKMDLNEVSERDLRVPGIGEITAERIVDRREELGYFTHWSDLYGIPYLGPNKMRILTENFYIGARNPGTSCYNDYPNNQRSYTTAAPSPLAELPGLGECKTEFQVLKEAQHPIPKSRFPNNAPAHSERQNFKPVKQTTKLGKMDLNEVSERDLRVPGIGEITAERIVDRREELGYFTHWSDLHGIPYLGPNKMRILTENFYIGARNPGTSCYNDYPNNQRSYTTAAPSPLAELPGLGECKTEFQVLKEAQHPIPKSRFPNNAPAHSERQNFKPVKQTTKLGKMDLNEVSERDLRVPGIGEITAERIVDRREELGYFTHWSDLHGIPYLGPNKMRILTENFYIGARNPGTSCYNDYPNNQRSYTTAAPSPLAELPGLGECKTEFQVLKEAQHPIPKSRFPNNAPAHSERQNFKPVKQTTKLGKMDLNEVSERDLRVPGIGEITAERIADRREELGYFTHWSDLHEIPYLGPNKMRILTENFYIGARNPGTSCYNDYPNNQRSYTTAAPSPLAELPGLGECKTELGFKAEAQHQV